MKPICEPSAACSVNGTAVLPKLTLQLNDSTPCELVSVVNARIGRIGLATGSIGSYETTQPGMPPSLVEPASGFPLPPFKSPAQPANASSQRARRITGPPRARSGVG